MLRQYESLFLLYKEFVLYTAEQAAADSLFTLQLTWGHWLSSPRRG